MDKRQLQIVLKLQDDASRELRKLSGELNGAEKQTSRLSGTMGFLKNAVVGAAAALGAAGVAGATWGIKIAAQLETAEVGLKTLLGSAEEAEETIERLKKEAARTPFELPGLTQATQLLTSVTKDGDRSIDILLDVGEALAAMGKGQAELDRIIVNLQQIAATGRAATIDIRQFAFAGIPIYEMLTETTGKSGEALEDLITSGGVTFDLLTQMFDEANDEGGRFFNAFVNQSGTFNQALSNMKDSLGIFFAEMTTGTGLFSGLTRAMLFASEVIGNYREHTANLVGKMTELFALLEEKTGLISLFKDAFANVAFVYNETLKPELEDLWERLVELKPLWIAMAQVLGATLVGAITLVTIGLQTFIIAITQVISWGVKLTNAIAGVWVTTIDKLSDAILKVKGFVDGLVDSFRSAIDLAKELGGGALDYVKKVLPGRAVGGPVTAGQAYVVGEQGPEVFVPQGNGNIMRNGQLAAGGGPSINVNVYGDVSGRELVEKVTEAIGMDIKRRIRT